MVTLFLTQIISKIYLGMKARYSRTGLLQSSILLLSLSSIVVLGWLYGLQPSITRMEIHPTGIPWLQSQESCESTGRLWQDDICWDTEHDPTF